MARAAQAFVGFLLIAGPLHAASLGIDSRPPGVYLRIEGPTKIAGNTPLEVQTWPRGDYRLTVDWVGFASSRGRLRSDGEQGLALRRAAGPAALLAPPGYSQMRGGEPWRGLTLLAAGTTGGIGLAIKFSDVSTAEDAVALAQDAYDNSVSGEAITLARIGLETASDRLHDDRQVRNLWAAYTATVWVGSALEAWLFTPTPALQQDAPGRYIVSLPTATGAQAVWRSVLVPGSGQRYLGREFMSNLFTTGFFGSASAALYLHDWYLEAERRQAYAQRRYDASQTEAETRRWRLELISAADEAHSRNAWRWGFIGATGAFYVWNLLDAALAGNDSAHHTNVAWSFVPSPDGALAAVRWRLP